MARETGTDRFDIGELYRVRLREWGWGWAGGIEKQGLIDLT